MELLTTNNVWMMVCAALVFFMHLGFSFLEIGLTRQKNTINILFKNFFIITMGIIVYCLVGFNLMYPGDFNIIGAYGGILGFAGPGLDAVAASDLSYNEGYTYWTDFLFQAMFAATAGTIISGAVAERIKINSFMLIVFLYVAIVYPIVGSWQWGSGFLSTLTEEVGFYDFAGSTLVHSVGGWGALVIIYLLGARKGKFDSDGNAVAIPGSNIPLSAAGVLILWLGWFGFNGGSQLAMGTGNDAIAVSKIFINTLLAGAGGVMAAGALTKLSGKTDVIQMLNGCIGGLVAITAEPLLPSPLAAILIGAVGGVIVVYGTKLLFAAKIDDVVGAIPAHLFAGIWGTLVVPVTNSGANFGTQLLGVIAINVFVFVVALIVWSTMKATMGIRLSKEAELKGTDVTETGVIAYAIRD